MSYSIFKHRLSTNYTGGIKEFTPKEGINISHRKENHFYGAYTVVTFHKGEFKELIDLRLYGTNSKNYACLWVHGAGIFANGSGSAGGYGYDRESAACLSAFKSAGVSFGKSWGGVGECAIEEALALVAKKLFPRNKNIEILKSHA